MRRVLALLPAVVLSCSLSLDGFTGGATATGDDGGAEAGDAGGGDVVSPSDAGGGDAAVDASAGFVPCRMRAASSNLLFCDDFDDPGEQVGSKWTSMQGTITSTSTARSAPLAMQAVVPKLTTTYGFSNMHGSATVPSGATAVDYRFALNVESLGAAAGNGYLSFGSLHFTDSSCPTQGTNRSRRVEITTGSDGQLALFLVGLGAECNATSTDDTVSAATTVHVDGAPRWMSIAVRAALAPCPGKTGGSSITLFVDGVVAVCQPTGVDPMTKTSSFFVELGISDGDPWNAAKVDYDDVEIVSE